MINTLRRKYFNALSKLVTVSSHPSDFDPLAFYSLNCASIPGFFTFESIVIWDFFLKAQWELDVHGNALEVGVYKGRSAALTALYLRPKERFVLVDLNPMTEAARVIDQLRSGNIYLETRSADLLGNAELRDSRRSFRWCHIDGDHTGYAVSQDLQTADFLLNEAGIICVDDFFNFRYPQLTAAVYQFLLSNPLNFRMLFCGANKCYICRSVSYARYEEKIRRDFQKQIRRNNIDVQLVKSSYASDFGCFSTQSQSPKDAPPIGMDDNPEFLPF